MVNRRYYLRLGRKIHAVTDVIFRIRKKSVYLYKMYFEIGQDDLHYGTFVVVSTEQTCDVMDKRFERAGKSCRYAIRFVSRSDNWSTNATAAPGRVAADCDDASKAQHKVHLRSCVDTASRANEPEAALLNRIIRSLNLRSTGIRLV